MLSGSCHAPCTVGGYEAGGLSGEVGWALGQSGALSLRGWSQRHGIDGVVMRDGDVRKTDTHSE